MQRSDRRVSSTFIYSLQIYNPRNCKIRGERALQTWRAYKLYLTEWGGNTGGSPLNSESVSDGDGGDAPQTLKGMGELKGAECEDADMAKPALYLASDDEKYVTGHNLVVDDGMSAFKIASFDRDISRAS
ncbi:unnamed protein product [Arabis nemorensis]|uniref:Uncharacterized protein n=1 Tax=Arabis nemorensis TaxID=586526 RepID=A0A565BS01_9BRAS|nr:unnamed protein product [Arabis nemorensis]